MIERLKRGSIKMCRRAIWRALALRAKSLPVEVLHQSSANGTVLCVHGPAYIEPESGYIISEDGFLLLQSFLAYPAYIHYDRPLKYHAPSPSHFWRVKNDPQSVIIVPEVISLRYFWEWNYYHFYFDVLSKLELLDYVGVDIRIPLAIAQYADDVNFAYPLIGRGEFAGYKWLNPGTKFIRAEKIILCETVRPYRDRITYLNRALKVHPISGSDDMGRIFLNRTNNRCISNLDELRPILEAHKFHEIDSGHMSIDDQIKIFSNARYLVANHGAGTTNIIFRGGSPLDVLELHSDKYMNYDHRRICSEMRYGWNHLEGKAVAGNGVRADFLISPDALDQGIHDLLRNTPHH